MHVAALRVHSGHDVLDDAVLARRVHRLKNQQHRPLVLRVKLVLKIRQRLHADGQRLLRARLEFGLDAKRVRRVKILEPKFLSVRDAE